MSDECSIPQKYIENQESTRFVSEGFLRSWNENIRQTQTPQRYSQFFLFATVFLSFLSHWRSSTLFFVPVLKLTGIINFCLLRKTTCTCLFKYFYHIFCLSKVDMETTSKDVFRMINVNICVI